MRKSFITTLLGNRIVNRRIPVIFPYFSPHREGGQVKRSGKEG
jgi:hypothetical protein